MRRSALNLLGPTDMAVILIGAWSIITMLYCSMMLLITLVAGDGLQVWTLKGLGTGIIVGIVVWVFHSIDTYGWGGWGEMVRRAKVAIHIRYLEFQNR